MTDTAVTTEKTIPSPASVYGCVIIYILLWYLGRDRWQQARPARPPAMPSRDSSRLRVGSLNIRYAPSPNADPPAGTNPNAEYPWTGYRKEALLDQVAWEEPDVIGFQEVLSHQFQDLKEELSAVYDSVGVGRIDGKQDGEVRTVCVAQRPDMRPWRLHPHTCSTFDAAFPRLLNIQACPIFYRK